MSEPVRLLTPSQAIIDEKNRLEKLATPVKEVDRSTYERILPLYKQVCLQVRSLLNLPNFRGGFDEWAALAMDPQYYSNPQLDILSKQGQSLNELITYEASKLGIVPPDWWKECWKDELEQQNPAQTE